MCPRCASPSLRPSALGAVTFRTTVSTLAGLRSVRVRLLLEVDLAHLLAHVAPQQEGRDGQAEHDQERDPARPHRAGIDVPETDHEFHRISLSPRTDTGEQVVLR